MADLGEDSVQVKPPIIMKVDGPPEDNNTITSQVAGGSNHNRSLGDHSDSKIKTPVKPKKPVLSSSRLNPLTMRSSVLSSPKLNSGVVLRPSALGSRLENNKCMENSKNSNRSNHSDGETLPKFVPLGVTEPCTTTSTPAAVASTSNFVFGQNLHERVVSESEDNNTTSSSNANGTSSELLFSNAAQQTTVTGGGGKSLSESAREYEESRANKRKYEAVVVVTGEEDEHNVLQINCKLFAFDKASGNWQERGRGTLRLNDKAPHSRLVFRTAGSHRVVLNTKIWAEMTVDRASDKSLRLTAMDATGQIKVFLIMASGDEVSQLQRLLEARLHLKQEPQPKKKH